MMSEQEKDYAAVQKKEEVTCISYRFVEWAMEQKHIARWISRYFYRFTNNKLDSRFLLLYTILVCYQQQWQYNNSSSRG